MPANDDLEVIRELLTGKLPSQDVNDYVRGRLTAVIAAESHPGAGRPVRRSPRSRRAVAGVGRLHRRRLALRPVAGVAAALAAGAVVLVAVVVPGAGHDSTGGAAVDTAYVVSRTESALAAVGSQDRVESTQVTTSGGLEIEFQKGGTLVVADLGSRGSTRVAAWVYRRRDKFAAYTSSGQLTSVAGITAARQRRTTTSVDYQHRTWWRSTWSALLPFAPEPKLGCADLKLADLDILGLSGGDQAAALRAALSCGDYTMAGTHLVDGVQTVELEQVPSAALQFQMTFWVDPASYLPVRSVATFEGPGMAGRAQVDYRWLPPTPANVADLDVTIPPGFTEVPAPAP
jgi:hypothetical protein